MPITANLPNHLPLKLGVQANGTPYAHTDVITSIAALPATSTPTVPVTTGATPGDTTVCVVLHNNAFYLYTPTLAVAATTNAVFTSTELAAATTAGTALKTTPGGYNNTTVYAWNIPIKDLTKLLNDDAEKNKPAVLQCDFLTEYFNLVCNNTSIKNFTNKAQAKYLFGKDNDLMSALVTQDINTKKNNFKADSFATAKSMGFAYSIWVYLGAMAGTGAGSTILMSVLGPLALGITAAYTDYYAQINAYKEKFGGDEPSDAIKAKMWAESKQLGYKMTAIAGASYFSYELLIMAYNVLSIADPTQIGAATQIAAGALVSVLAAAVVLVVAIYQLQQKNPGKSISEILNANKGDLVKLFVAVFVAGLIYSVMNAYSWILPSFPGLNEAGAAFFDSLLKGTAVYYAVTTVFSVLSPKPEETWAEFKKAGVFSKFSPISLKTEESYNDNFELKQARASVIATKP